MSRLAALLAAVLGAVAGRARAAGREPAPGLIVDTDSALEEEFEAIHGKPADCGAFGADRSALCLSGGGIRSAAFCLGVMQALADRHLLSGFDYLSTVSGGGFVGGWLSMIIRRVGVTTAEAMLAESCAEGGRTTPAELRDLREFTNYLTPRGGLFSADTWTAYVLVVRNLLLNWLVFLPWFLVPVVLTALYRETLWLAGESGAIAYPLAALAAATLLLGTVWACLGLPSHRRVADGAWDYLSRPSTVWLVVVPSVVWTSVLPMTFSRHWLTTAPPGPEWAIPAVYVAVTLAGYAVAGLVDAGRNPERRGRSPFVGNLSSWLIASAVAASFLLLGLWLGRVQVPWGMKAEVLAVAGPLWFVLVSVIHSAVHVALRPETSRADLDREWLARVSAYKLRPAFLWAVFASCCLLIPRYVHWVTVQSAWAGLAAGPVGAWLGKQVVARAQGNTGPASPLDRVFSIVPPVLCLVFALALFALLGRLVHDTLEWFTTSLPPLEGCDATTEAAGTVAARALQFWSLLRPGCGGALGDGDASWERATLLLVAGVVLAGSGWWLGMRINVNRFSLHAVYRNRITRAFLGSARGDRRPVGEPLTGFDEGDIASVASLGAGRGAPWRLFPVINTSLNLSFSDKLSWSERKAAPFTFTPLRSGAAALPSPEQDAAAPPAGRFVRTALYAGLEHAEERVSRAAADDTGPSPDGVERPSGMRLPGALTISGAAVSPNWGYHSSPITAFVMTLFNVRLGAWLPNPANRKVERSEGLLAAAMPPNSAGSLFRELVGWTDATSQAVYLSDGGHFDNLGLYEMVRRRCRLILVVDAGQDREAALRDLGEVVRRVGIDFNAIIELDRSGILSRVDSVKAAAPGPAGFAVGRVRYADCAEGILVYLKASWLHGLPVDVQAYGDRRTEFPHESTLDQAFTESQFESYRALGLAQARRLFKGAPGAGGLRAVFEHLSDRDAVDKNWLAELGL